MRKLSRGIVVLVVVAIALISCTDDQESSDEEAPPAPTDITAIEVPALGNDAPPDIPIAIDDERYPISVPSGDDLDQAQNLYEQHCAECHGIDGEGQQPDPNAPGMAPPHDESGHTWHHPDQQNFSTVWLGTANMPAFHDKLSTEEILLILGYIKNWWGEDFQQTQEGRTISLINNPPSN